MSEAQTQTDTTIGYRVPRLWTVRVINDDFTPLDFVTNMLGEIFNKTEEESMSIAIQVHEKGSGIVGIYTKDIAITKTTRAMRMSADSGHPLETIAEAIE